MKEEKEQVDKIKSSLKAIIIPNLPFSKEVKQFKDGEIRDWVELKIDEFGFEYYFKDLIDLARKECEEELKWTKEQLWTGKQQERIQEIRADERKHLIEEIEKKYGDYEDGVLIAVYIHPEDWEEFKKEMME
jgi:alkanesulfonate monooxygenase SsuD/methylene tetrahydromethanopterin reductase-like flavin-dependent oxidoreductase (luciferase family)